LSLALTGCAVSPTAAPTSERGLSIRGNVHGGQQPITGAHVYLFAANTTGYGQPSVSTLSPTAPGAATDSIGTYVTTDANGAFTITGDYTCITGTQLYLYSLGGNPGAGNNSAAGLLAILGQCPSSGSLTTTVPFVLINEVSTIAAAYSFAGFATDATHVSSSGTLLAQTGIANAFANAANLADVSTGAALTTTAAGNGTVPQAEINTLANILGACINTTGTITGPTNPTTCYTLFSNALSSGTTGNPPTDTATAAINIAHHPGSNISALYAIPAPVAPFAPTLSRQPKDFSMFLIFTGGGLATPLSIAIDQVGNAWVTDATRGVIKLSSSGAILSGAYGYPAGGGLGPGGIAIDLSGNAWIPVYYSGSVIKLSNSGSFLSGASGFPVGGITYPSAIGVDVSGNAWTLDTQRANVVKLSNSGAVLSGGYGYIGGAPIAIGFDGSGNLLIANYRGGSVTKLSSSGTILSGTNGYTGGGLAVEDALAIDGEGNAWVTSKLSGTSLPGGVTKLSNSGAILIAADGVNGTGGLYQPNGIAIDGAGSAWITNESPSTGIIQLSSSGALLSTLNGYTSSGLSSPEGIAIDGSGNVWVADEQGSVAEIIGAATPVITPIVAGLPLTPTTDGTSKLGTRP
jgi:hypothetical protein